MTCKKATGRNTQTHKIRTHVRGVLDKVTQNHRKGGLNGALAPGTMTKRLKATTAQSVMYIDAHPFGKIQIIFESSVKQSFWGIGINSACSCFKTFSSHSHPCFQQGCKKGRWVKEQKQYIYNNINKLMPKILLIYWYLHF